MTTFTYVDAVFPDLSLAVCVCSKALTLPFTLVDGRRSAPFIAISLFAAASFAISNDVEIVPPLSEPPPETVYLIPLTPWARSISSAIIINQRLCIFHSLHQDVDFGCRITRKTLRSKMPTRKNFFCNKCSLAHLKERPHSRVR